MDFENEGGELGRGVEESQPHETRMTTVERDPADALREMLRMFQSSSVIIEEEVEEVESVAGLDLATPLAEVVAGGRASDMLSSLPPQKTQGFQDSAAGGREHDLLLFHHPDQRRLPSPNFQSCDKMVAGMSTESHQSIQNQNTSSHPPQHADPDQRFGRVRPLSSAPAPAPLAAITGSSSSSSDALQTPSLSVRSSPSSFDPPLIRHPLQTSETASRFDTTRAGVMLSSPDHAAADGLSNTKSYGIDRQSDVPATREGETWGGKLGEHELASFCACATPFYSSSSPPLSSSAAAPSNKVTAAALQSALHRVEKQLETMVQLQQQEVREARRQLRCFRFTAREGYPTLLATPTQRVASSSSASSGLVPRRAMYSSCEAQDENEAQEEEPVTTEEDVMEEREKHQKDNSTKEQKEGLKELLPTVFTANARGAVHHKATDASFGSFGKDSVLSRSSQYLAANTAAWHHRMAIQQAKQCIAREWSLQVIPWFKENVLEGFYLPTMRRLNHLHHRIQVLRARLAMVAVAEGDAVGLSNQGSQDHFTRADPTPVVEPPFHLDPTARKCGAYSRRRTSSGALCAVLTRLCSSSSISTSWPKFSFTFPNETGSPTANHCEKRRLTVKSPRGTSVLKDFLQALQGSLNPDSDKPSGTEMWASDDRAMRRNAAFKEVESVVTLPLNAAEHVSASGTNRTTPHENNSQSDLEEDNQSQTRDNDRNEQAFHARAKPQQAKARSAPPEGSATEIAVAVSLCSFNNHNPAGHRKSKPPLTHPRKQKGKSRKSFLYHRRKQPSLVPSSLMVSQRDARETRKTHTPTATTVQSSTTQHHLTGMSGNAAILSPASTCAAVTSQCSHPPPPSLSLCCLRNVFSWWFTVIPESIAGLVEQCCQTHMFFAAVWQTRYPLAPPLPPLSLSTWFSFCSSASGDHGLPYRHCYSQAVAEAIAQVTERRRGRSKNRCLPQEVPNDERECRASSTPISSSQWAVQLLLLQTAQRQESGVLHHNRDESSRPTSLLYRHLHSYLLYFSQLRHYVTHLNAIHPLLSDERCREDSSNKVDHCPWTQNRLCSRNSLGMSPVSCEQQGSPYGFQDHNRDRDDRRAVHCCFRSQLLVDTFEQQAEEETQWLWHALLDAREHPHVSGSEIRHGDPDDGSLLASSAVSSSPPFLWLPPTDAFLRSVPLSRLLSLLREACGVSSLRYGLDTLHSRCALPITAVATTTIGEKHSSFSATRTALGTPLRQEQPPQLDPARAWHHHAAVLKERRQVRLFRWEEESQRLRAELFRFHHQPPPPPQPETLEVSLPVDPPSKAPLKILSKSSLRTTQGPLASLEASSASGQTMQCRCHLPAWQYSATTLAVPQPLHHQQQQQEMQREACVLVDPTVSARTPSTTNSDKCQVNHTNTTCWLESLLHSLLALKSNEKRAKIARGSTCMDTMHHDNQQESVNDSALRILPNEEVRRLLYVFSSGLQNDTTFNTTGTTKPTTSYSDYPLSISLHWPILSCPPSSSSGCEMIHSPAQDNHLGDVTDTSSTTPLSWSPSSSSIVQLPLEWVATAPLWRLLGHDTFQNHFTPIDTTTGE